MVDCRELQCSGCEQISEHVPMQHGRVESCPLHTDAAASSHYRSACCTTMPSKWPKAFDWVLQCVRMDTCHR